VRLAWFSPLPPTPSGIADYSFELLPLIAEATDVEVFCPHPGRFRRVRGLPGIPVRPPDRFDPSRFEAVYFQLGNNPHHEFVYEAARRYRGICVFHDVVLHHLIAHATVESRWRPDRYAEILVAEQGEAGARLARLRVKGVASDFEKFLFPLSSHVASRAAGLVVHSEDSRERLGHAAGGVPVEVIPHHAGAPPPQVAGVTREEARRQLGFPERAFLAGHLGFVTMPKQPAALVGGFARLHAERPDARLIVIGADNTGGGFRRVVRQRGLDAAVISTGFVDLVRFYLYLKALDVVVNLRYPTAGESSGTFARALSEGKATIVNNYGSFTDVPREAALKVEIDGPQADQLGDHLLRLARDSGFRTAIEARAKAYATSVLDPRRCRDQYVAFAERIAGDGQLDAHRARRGG
jgi:glycosyltransferase involved in cell wall biosynthesis